MDHSGDSRAVMPMVERGQPKPTSTGDRVEAPVWETTAAAPAHEAEAARPKQSGPGTSRAKRTLDVVVVITALPLACVLGAVIAALVVLTSRGGAFFVHERVGLGGRRFGMLKFRTMAPDADEQLRSDPELWQQYVDNDYKLPPSMDNRVTPVGRFLRRSSLDELPQLLNVLRGEMSLVGPRPIVPNELENYGGDGDSYVLTRPGLTGAWQVNGRSGVGYPERVDLDRHYIDSWTFWLDVKILLQTPVAVFTSRGAF
jgi:lipopolysaccharide/colanic/teichoic acid biosynthesis glycosyltransferase